MIDRYTRIVLTTIAILLGVIVVRDVPIVREALAADDYFGTVPVTIVAIDNCGNYSGCEWDTIYTRERQ